MVEPNGLDIETVPNELLSNRFPLSPSNPDRKSFGISVATQSAQR